MFRHIALTMSHPYRLPPAGRCDMAHTTKPTRENRTITVDFHDEATYFALLSDGKAFVEFVLAFILSLGLQLTHQSTCNGGSRLTRHSPYARVRLGGLSIWRMQCTSGKAVFTVLPHCILRYRKMQWGNTVKTALQLVHCMRQM